ncbi:manganese efflux pump [Paraclostridium bifermentans]|uniref:manganese efflux pump n=1 Tax=Paraclostridium bifermentans TaxID=1490 RepID=UPI00359C8739
MHILSIALFSISSNLDNLTVSIGYGMENIKIKFFSNFIISFISALGTFISMSVGAIVVKFINPKIANNIGSFILIFIGLYFCYQFFKNKSDNNLINNPSRADKDNSKVIEPKESISLAFALTINNFGVGFGASVAGLNVFITSIVTFFISTLFLEIGDKLGSGFFSKIFGKYSDLISGLLIAFIGVYEIFI